MTKPLTLGYSTCPNDTFLFHALAHARVDRRGLDFDIRLADVERLNQAAEGGELDVTKLSFAAVGHLRERYALLRSGAALGRGCGPLLISRPGFDPSRLGRVPIAVPGMRTTAAMLLGLYLSRTPACAPMTFDKIMPAVSRGEYEAGVIIHEGRFTFRNHGLAELVDLGRWWEDETGLPIPLGGIAVRRDLGPEVARRVEVAIRDSVAHAFAHPADSAEYIRAHAQEMADDVVRQHIALYVNDFTLDLGEEGVAAVAELFRRGHAAGLLPDSREPLLAGDVGVS
ncbi:1,4-dihydroxy-6-naphthoate synthase [Desulfococcus sp.]|uniref:1,4-dihydroxy-6-naphthoate synthase n=1 Tax=Desulfococcus sp. TaxID=2025834 RepID=UPI0035944E3E